MLLIYFTLLCFASVVFGTDDIDCNDGSFYIRADPKSPNHFYKCDNGEPVHFKCPDNLCFNEKLHVCDWPKNVAKSAKKTSGTSKASNSVEPKPEVSKSGQKGSTNIKPSNNEVQYAGNNKKTSNNAQQQNTKPTNTAYTSGSGTTAEIPWHLQSYSTDDEDIYAVQIIDNNLDLNGLGYKDSSKSYKSKS